jgi:hypothetical protein
MAITITGTGVSFPSNGTIEGFYTGSTINNTSFPIGSYIYAQNTNAAYLPLQNTSDLVYISSGACQNIFSYHTAPSGGPVTLTGTWVCRGFTRVCCCNYLAPVLMQRIA